MKHNKAHSLGAAATDEAEEKRKKVSKRVFIDSAGNEVEKIEQANGARYILLDPTGNKQFDYQFGEAGTMRTMCAIFGFVTKVGNVANTVLNDKDEPGTPTDAADSIAEFVTSAEGGTWAERTGGVGAKVDRDALAEAIVRVLIASGKLDETDATAVGNAKDTRRKKLDDDSKYLTASRKMPEVAAEYAKIKGQQVLDADSL